MTIEQELTKLETNLTNSYTAVSNKGGTLPASENFDNLATAIDSITTGGTIESLSITPTTSQQIITASGGIDGYSPVSVSAVTSAIDSHIKARFIRNGVEILGVTGTYGEPLLPEVFTSSTGNTTWYINENGELYGCGENNNGQQGSGNTTTVKTFTKRADNVVQLGVPYYTTWYINEDGELYGCGRNDYGQQGSGTSGSGTEVKTFTKRADNAVLVANAMNATWYINENGELYGCGANSLGQQGSGDTTNVTTFTKRGDNVVQLCKNITNTTWYINEDGELYGCGYNSYGQQGSGTSGSGTEVKTFTKRADNAVLVANANNGSTTWYINKNGELYGCGSNWAGQQGSGTSGSGTEVKTFTKRADNAVLVACANDVTWYINEDGELYGCGANSSGQQGSGDTTNVTTFTKRADNVVQVACSSNSTWYINEDGELYGCGNNDYGQQGSGTSGNTTNVTTFTKRADNVVQVACSSATWYVNKYGELYGCGWNSNGQQGSGNTTNVTTFTKRN